MYEIITTDYFATYATTPQTPRYDEKGISHIEAEKRAWATVNKQEGGGKIVNDLKSVSSFKLASSKSSLIIIF